MPRRVQIRLHEIVDRNNLLDAVNRAAQGRRTRVAVRRFLMRLDDELNQISSAILRQTWVPRKMRSLVIHDPKRRRIHAPAFCDRVVHHAILLLAEQHFDNTLIADTFACRRGKGAIAAVQRAQYLSRRYGWYLKMDIAGYFHSINHNELLVRLRRRFRDEDFCRLLETIVRSFEVTQGTGLPIGALTSQHFANLYLNDFDRWITAKPEVRGYVRYMDDMICWTATKSQALCLQEAAKAFLADFLSLTLKEKVLVHSVEQGLPFCGHRIFPGTIRLSRRRQRLYRRCFRRWEHRFRQGLISAEQLQAGYASACSLVQHADCGEWLRRWLHLHLVKDA